MIKVNLKKILKEKNMTLTDLHNITGITQNALSLFANNKSNGIQYSTLEKIISTLDIEISELLQPINEVATIQIDMLDIKRYSEYSNEEFVSVDIHFLDKESNKIIDKIIFKFGIKPIYNNENLDYLLIEESSHSKISNQQLEQLLTIRTRENKPSELLKILSHLIARKIITHNHYNINLRTIMLFKWTIIPHFNMYKSLNGSTKSIEHLDNLIEVRPIPVNIEELKHPQDININLTIDLKSLSHLSIFYDFNSENDISIVLS
ncbi:helix-turn-helix domain-containing protein [Macrococcoides bohemicum]|uniref:helix-turn-helix domain-containing protein n=1 Tax=Macrococcoides bohemicum TaxID=1903056 RepID=UPI000BB53266|nr:helix-turn-helix transcriptional regulator [Macrococcus sp. IME1552]ATD31324.1 hypothetical protein BHM04_09040 [Macrococcus sp. IME1552]